MLTAIIATLILMQPDPPCEFPVLPPPADWNGDGGVDGFDLESFFCDWADGAADVNWDSVCDRCDVLLYLDSWSQG